MKRSVKSLIGYTMSATDGAIGKVKDVYFDDETWTIRYLILETCDWLSGRKVLICSQALLATNWHNETFPINLTKKQIEHSPVINTDMPVSRQQEMQLHEYYPWSNYWVSGMGIAGMGTTGMVMPMRESVGEEISEKAHKPNKKPHGDHHLRSTETLIDYKVKAKDGDIGEIEDFIIDNTTWKMIFLVIDTGDWFPGKKVLLSSKWIKEINWDLSRIDINLTEVKVKNSPEYYPHQLINDVYEKNYYDYYGEGLYNEQQ
jgi:sporulation protein YlmC with PRC-barrel domain